MWGPYFIGKIYCMKIGSQYSLNYSALDNWKGL